MIITFKDKETESLSKGYKVPKFTNYENPARRKLAYLAAAVKLEDLRAPPGNRLEQLEGDRKGQHSIRINGQYRICFVWIDCHAYEVEITDYH